MEILAEKWSLSFHSVGFICYICDIYVSSLFDKKRISYVVMKKIVWHLNYRCLQIIF